MFMQPRYSVLWAVLALTLALGTRAFAAQAHPTAIRRAVTASVPNASSVIYPTLPSNLSPPTYDYSVPNMCPSCHFILGLDHTARAAGVVWNNTTQTWQFTGSGWLAAWHSQSDHGENENTFCAKCHSPLQASPAASFSGGFTVNAQPIPPGRFAAVNCITCHPPDNVTTVLAAQNPTALLGGALAIYRWKGYNNPASYQAVVPGQEDTLCLNCHEERHSQTNAAFESMYSSGVRCLDCHMAPYQYLGGGTTGLPQLPERFHDWRVAENEPYSCGAGGSLAEFSCHSEFSGTDAQQLIPFLMQQHSDWWNLPPFNGQPQVALSAHSWMTAKKYRLLWQEIAQVDKGAIQ